MNFFLSKKYLIILLCFSLAGNIALVSNHRPKISIQDAVSYNQEEDLSRKIITMIEEADEYVYFAVYTFTLDEIASALIAAHLRGLRVQGILDYKQSLIEQEKPIISKMKKYGIPIAIPLKSEGIMHLKLLVTDKGYASGSYNWTYSGTALNDEVLQFGHSNEIQEQYKTLFLSMYKKYESSVNIPDTVLQPLSN